MSGRTRHVPLRRCAVCRSSLTKESLVRLVQGEGGWRVDAERRAGGRGTWVCHDCVVNADERTRRRGFGRAFRAEADAVVTMLRRSGADVDRPIEDTAPGGLRTPARQGGTHG